MSEYKSWVNMNYGLIRFMGDNEILVNFRMVQASSGEGEGGWAGWNTDRYTDRQTDTQTHQHPDSAWRKGWQSEKQGRWDYTQL